MGSLLDRTKAPCLQCMKDAGACLLRCVCVCVRVRMLLCVCEVVCLMREQRTQHSTSKPAVCMKDVAGELCVCVSVKRVVAAVQVVLLNLATLPVYQEQAELQG